MRWTIIKFEEKTSATASRHPQSLFRERGEPPPSEGGSKKKQLRLRQQPKKRSGRKEGRKARREEGYGSQASETNFLCFCIIITPFFVSRQANCLSRSPACLRGRKDIIGGGKGNSVVTRGQSKKRAGTKLRTMGEKENKR